MTDIFEIPQTYKKLGQAETASLHDIKTKVLMSVLIIPKVISIWDGLPKMFPLPVILL